MKKAYLALVALFFNALAVVAQETKKVDVDIDADTGGSHWYGSPIVWIIGAAVFILLLVALTRGSGRRAD